jgi:hypothetical protein
MLLTVDKKHHDHEACPDRLPLRESSWILAAMPSGKILGDELLPCFVATEVPMLENVRVAILGYLVCARVANAIPRRIGCWCNERHAYASTLVRVAKAQLGNGK